MKTYRCFLSLGLLLIFAGCASQQPLTSIMVSGTNPETITQALKDVGGKGYRNEKAVESLKKLSSTGFVNLGKRKAVIRYSRYVNNSRFLGGSVPLKDTIYLKKNKDESVVISLKCEEPTYDFFDSLDMLNMMSLMFKSRWERDILKERRILRQTSAVLQDTYNEQIEWIDNWTPANTD